MRMEPDFSTPPHGVKVTLPDTASEEFQDAFVCLGLNKFLRRAANPVVLEVGVGSAHKTNS